MKIVISSEFDGIGWSDYNQLKIETRVIFPIIVLFTVCQGL